MAFNKVILIGNMVSDPEIKQTNSGMKVSTFSIAVNRRGKDAGVDFINCVAWDKKAEFLAQFFKKGKPILVCGQLQQRTWTDKNGQKRYEYEVIADELTFAGESAAPTQAPAEKSAMPYIPEAYKTDKSNFEEIADDGMLPF